MITHKIDSVSNGSQVRIRIERDRRLDEVDTVHCNADRWELMDDAEKTAWRDYKDRLRQLPDQPGFPHSVHWPAPPNNGITR